MTTAKIKNKVPSKKNEHGRYLKEAKHAEISSGEMIVMLRELKTWTQDELAKRSGIASTNLSRLEHGHVNLGKDRAVLLAKAFGIHPATLMFPDLAFSEMLPAFKKEFPAFSSMASS